MFNPTRRSRNIGKTQGGRVKDGTAAEKRSRRSPRTLWSRLSEEEHSEGYTVLSDHPSRDYFHPVSEADIRTTLARMPKRLTRSLRAVLLPRIAAGDVIRGIEARRRYLCIILNPFPKTLHQFWTQAPPSEVAIRHYAPWGTTWEQTHKGWYQIWTLDNLRRYYLYHLLLHELGHINQPPFNALKRRESFAEDFALTWARRLGVLPRIRRKKTPPTIVN